MSLTAGFGKQDRMAAICELCEHCDGICYKKNNGGYVAAEPISLQ